MCILELCKEEHSPEPLFRNGHPLCCSVGGCNTFLSHQYQCPRVFVYFSCPSPTDIIWSKVPVCCVERDRSHLFMPVEVGSLQVGCVAAWFTAARNQVDISKCCRPVNKTLTCTLSWHLKPSHIQTTWTLKKDTYSLARSQIKDKWEQLRASCGHLIFPLRSKKKSRLIFYVWAVRWTNKNSDVVSVTWQADWTSVSTCSRLAAPKWNQWRSAVKQVKCVSSLINCNLIHLWMQ